MARKKERRPAREARAGADVPALARQAGQFEAATGVAHGPVAVVVAMVAALLVIPVKRALAAAARSVGRRRA